MGNALPKISLDYQELKSRAKSEPMEGAKLVKIMFAKSVRTGCTLSCCVESKGMQDTWIVKRLVEDFEELGRRHNPEDGRRAGYVDTAESDC